MDPFEIKRNDLLPILEGVVVLRKSGDVATNLASAPYPRFLMRASGAASPIISATAGATIVNASQAQVAYLWQSGDTATAGYYQGELEFTFPGPKKLTAPGRGYIPISINLDLGP